ncbi:MAG: type II secretion system ATPase GspE [Bdellovibrionales bacterium]|nr:type II secretion system ATPase GspE [Bdellovibrionales bacterium]
MATDTEEVKDGESEERRNSPASLRTLSQLLNLEFVERLPEPTPPLDLRIGDFDRIAGSWGRQFSTIPIGGDHHEVVVASADPLNIGAIEQLKMCYGRPAKLVVTTPDEITKAINTMRTRLMSSRSSALEKDKEEESEFDYQLKIDVTDAEDDDAPIMRYVNAIIFKANSERASDVHIEPFETQLKVRFRIDGVLYDVDSQDKVHQAAIISRVKVMSGLNIAEKRLPQDGRIGLKIAGKDVDIRVSTVPTQFGERVVMRLLDKSASVLGLEQVGIRKKNLLLLEKLIQKPNGIILVTGPTGSGKSTTLYSCLTKINTPELNILTVEDPIEYQLEGVGQMQVNPKINFTFSSGLRAILRQDPDVVMVGEIRDAETAEIAIQASLTGHLVLSTLHTNDAPGAVTRLLDMGIEPFLVSSSLLAVMGQRLVRRLCPACKEAYELSDAEILELGLHPRDLVERRAYKPGQAECEACQNTRYMGRTGIHELLVVDDSIRSLILQRMDSTTIRIKAQELGFETLRIDGAHKVLEGITSVEEVILATHEEVTNA